MSTQTPVLQDAGPKERTVLNKTGIVANQSAAPIMLVPTTGMYRLNCYWVNIVSGTGGDVLPNVSIAIADESGAQTLYMAQASGLTATEIGCTSTPFWCVAGTMISYTVSGGTFAGGLSFNLHFVLETL